MTPMSDPAAIMRRLRNWQEGREHGDVHAANDELTRLLGQSAELIDALVAERDEARQRVRELEADPDRPTVIYAGDELEAAETEVSRLNHENAALKALLEVVEQEVIAAMGSLSRGPAKDGLAYSRLNAAAVAIAVSATAAQTGQAE